MGFSKREKIDWDSEQVKIALYKVQAFIDKLKAKGKGKPGTFIYREHAIESVFAKYTGVYRTYGNIMKHLKELKTKEVKL